VLVLLPPSEGKTAPSRGRPVVVEKLVHADTLGPVRERVLAAVDPALREAHAAPAHAVYTGVLFQALGLDGLPRRARNRVLIASALWGVVRPDDRIPAYKLPIATKVPALGPLAALWRPALAQALPDRGLVLDLRSGGYAAAWRPERATVVTVRGFTERPGGDRAVISHMVKRIRGEVARHVLEAPSAPRSADGVAEIAAAAGLRVELGGEGRERTLDVIESAQA
jgi:cytoplasmic iron level regulating protein YaaA (DUF328/UPF0246 family)